MPGRARLCCVGLCYILFTGLFFLLFSHFLLIYGGLRFGVLQFWSWIWFLGGTFLLMGFGACGVGPSEFLGLGLSIQT